MAVTDREEFLKRNRFCVLGTLRKDGRARLSPMMYLYEDGKIYISTTSKRGGGRTARRDPRVSVCCIDPQSTYDYVIVYGSADYLSDEADSVRLFGAMQGRTLEGESLAKAQQRIRDEGRIVLRITPEEFYPA